MTLEELRRRITAIDRQMLELVAERQALSSEVAKVKRATGRATRDFNRERAEQADAEQKQWGCDKKLMCDENAQDQEDDEHDQHCNNDDRSTLGVFVIVHG